MIYLKKLGLVLTCLAAPAVLLRGGISPDLTGMNLGPMPIDKYSSANNDGSGQPILKACLDPSMLRPSAGWSWPRRILKD